MSHAWTHAVAAFRRSAGVDGYRTELSGPAIKALFITCSESPELTSLVASLRPAAVVQTLGGVAPSSADARQHSSIADTIEHAIAHLGVTHVVMCGHARCHAAHDDAGVRALMKTMGIGGDDSQRHLLMQRSRMEDYLHARGVNGDIQVGAIWIDAAEGEIHAYSPVQQHFIRCSDLELEQWIAQLQAKQAASSDVAA
ncbi:MAG: carbonic anhydrase [Vicinamibacterales bacterium]